MAQGAIKSKPSVKASSARRPNVLGPKKGARTIAPRKAGLVRSAKMTKKHSAGLTAMTERTLGAKAGHLELLGGGKKDKKFSTLGKGKDGKGGAKKGEVAEVKKGGSKKFG